MTSPLAPCACLELRQYTLRPGQRETFIDLFDQHLLDPQEAAGMVVLAQGRDLDDPDRVVWLRGYPELAGRAAALTAYYDGPSWQEHRAATNATIVDSDDVLLLRPVHAASGLALPALRPAEPGAGLIVATVWSLSAPVDDDFVRLFETRARPLLAERGGAPLAWYRTEDAPNAFPRHPVRADVHAFVWLASFATDDDHAHHRATLARSPAWRAVADALASRFAAPPQELRLSPTSRSRLRHDPAACARQAVAALTPASVSWAAPPPAAPTGDVHDFDFLAGAWRVVNRRLVQRGVGCTEWDVFEGTFRFAQYLGGVVNVDQLDVPDKGWSGMSVRTFDRTARRWSIYWVTSRLGQLFPPVTGGFTGDTGTFVGVEDDEGVPVQVVFTWTRRGPDAATWQQAFSRDGVTWETNWIMEFTRAAE